MRVLVTGASGFVGSYLIPHLAESGHEVVAVSRSARTFSGAAEVLAWGEDGPTVDDLLGVDAVVHLAALAHRNSAPAEDYYEINTAVTKLLAERAAEASVAKFIFLSSSKVHGDRSYPGRPIRSDEPLCPTANDHYGWSKAAAEFALERVANSSAMTVTALRPPVILGGKPEGNLAAVEKAIAFGLPIPTAKREVKRSFLDIEDLCDRVAQVLGLQPTNQFVAELLRSESPTDVIGLLQSFGQTSTRAVRTIGLPDFLTGALVKAAGILGRDISPMYREFVLDAGSSTSVSLGTCDYSGRVHLVDASSDESFFPDSTNSVEMQ